MTVPHLEYGGFRISALGLGCSRLGSMMGSSAEEAEVLISRALDAGITFFDTASSYGQGDSERILGRMVGQNDRICLATKVGKVVPWKARLLRPAKKVLRTLGRRSGAAGTLIRHSRSGQLHTSFTPHFLEQQLDASRRRLGIGCLPMVMLHSAPAEILQQGDAITVLEKARERGTLRMIGASIDDVPAAEAALEDDRIVAIQAPLHEGDQAMAEWAANAAKAGRLVVAREIFAGFQGLAHADIKAHIGRNLRRVLRNNAIGVSLVGTTKLEHLMEVIEMAAADISHDEFGDLNL